MRQPSGLERSTLDKHCVEHRVSSPLSTGLIVQDHQWGRAPTIVRTSLSTLLPVEAGSRIVATQSEVCHSMGRGMHCIRFPQETSPLP